MSGKPFRDVINDPPANLAEWDAAIRTDHHLHNYWQKQLRRMYHRHKAKALRANDERLARINFPGKFLFDLNEQGITGQEATDELAADLAYWTWKADKLRTITKCCRVEHKIRELLVADGRHPVEPDDGTEDEPDLPVETEPVTSVDGTIVRNPIGYNHL